MTSFRTVWWPTTLGVILTLAMFVIEVSTHVLGNVAYVAIVVYALWISVNRRQILLLAIFSTVVMVFGYLMAVTIHQPIDQITIFVNRASAIVVVWFASYFTLRHRKTLATELRQREEIEQRKLAEERLKSSQELYESIASNFPDGWIGVLDENLTYTFANGKGLRRAGIRKADIMGKKFSVFFDAEGTEPYLLDALGGKNVKFEINFKHRTLEIFAGPLLSSHKTNRVLVVVHDITALKETEKGLIEALEKERELGALKSRFVTMASHEFRTPLTTIMSSSSLLDRYDGDKYEREKKIHVTRIKQSAKLLNEMLNDMLSLNKLEEGNIKPHYTQINLDVFFESIVRASDSFKRANQKLSVKHSGVETIVSDREFLRNIVSVILSNAFRYTHDEDVVLLEADVNDEALTIKITDRGMGIPPEDQEYIFTRFFRGHNVANIPGTGLSLSIAKSYVDLLKGSIEFTSNLNEGTVFRVHVPVERDAKMHEHQLLQRG